MFRIFFVFLFLISLNFVDACKKKEYKFSSDSFGNDLCCIPGECGQCKRLKEAIEKKEHRLIKLYFENKIILANGLDRCDAIHAFLSRMDEGFILCAESGDLDTFRLLVKIFKNSKLVRESGKINYPTRSPMVRRLLNYYGKGRCPYGKRYYLKTFFPNMEIGDDVGFLGRVGLPLCIAAGNGKLNIVQEIRQDRFFLLPKKKGGVEEGVIKMAIYLAKKNGHDEVVKYLKGPSKLKKLLNGMCQSLSEVLK